jgi:hypothetical protein
MVKIIFFVLETTAEKALYIIIVVQMMNENHIGQAPMSFLHIKMLA